MTSRRKPITAAELEAQLEANPDFVARRAERDRILAERVAKWRIEEQPIVEDFKRIGWDIQSAWDLVPIAKPYPEAIPLLVKHLLLPYSDRVREGIIRALSVPDARYAWPIIVREYRKAPEGCGDDGFRLGAKGALAGAISAIATKDNLEELTALIKDESLGSSRVILLSYFRRLRNPKAKAVLEELSTHPAFAKQFDLWRKREK